MSDKNIMEMSKDEYLGYMEIRLANARQKRRERHRAWMDEYMEFRRGRGIVLSGREIEKLMGYLENDSDKDIESIYTKLIIANKKDGTN